MMTTSQAVKMWSNVDVSLHISRDPCIPVFGASSLCS